MDWLQDSHTLTPTVHRVSKENTQDTNSEAGSLTMALGDMVTCVITLFKIGIFTSSNNCVILFVYYVVFKCTVLLIFAVVFHLLSCVRLFVTPWTAACQAPLSSTISQSLLKFKPTELAMPSNHLILCGPLLLPSIFPSIRVFSYELALRIKWPYWGNINTL